MITTTTTMTITLTRMTKPTCLILLRCWRHFHYIAPIPREGDQLSLVGPVSSDLVQTGHPNQTSSPRDVFRYFRLSRQTTSGCPASAVNAAIDAAAVDQSARRVCRRLSRACAEAKTLKAEIQSLRRRSRGVSGSEGSNRFLLISFVPSFQWATGHWRYRSHVHTVGGAFAWRSPTSSENSFTSLDINRE